MTVKWDDVCHAFEYVSLDGGGANQAYLDKETGHIYWHSDYGDDIEELPEDIDDEKYVEIPNRKELDLGRRLVLRFAAAFLPDDYDEVSAIFSRRGAYRHFKSLLMRRGALERWHEFSNNAEEEALRDWCAQNNITLDE
jgi:hypothetical protein